MISINRLFGFFDVNKITFINFIEILWNYLIFIIRKMSVNKLEIDERLVRSLLDQQCPHWAKLPLKPVVSKGTVHALFRLGEEYVVRIPRIEWVAGSVDNMVEKEFKWIPIIGKLIDVLVAEPVFKGKSSRDYPWSWTIAKWNEGSVPDFEVKDEYHQLAEDLAHFLNKLHNIKPLEGPLSRRGVSLSMQDFETRNALAELTEDIDTQSVLELWRELLKVPEWSQNPLWLHGDLLPGNILIENCRLKALIDFSDMGIGDPACDLIVGWSLFNHSSRQVFRNHLEGIDDNTWERGKGWALSIALIMLPYYKHSNPYMASLARFMIANILNDR